MSAPYFSSSIAPTRRACLGLLFAYFFCLLASRCVAADVSFSRDIRPLLSDRCFACHGPDEQDRQATLRLDQANGPDGAYREDSGIVAISPGSLENSELWYRITSDDPDVVMPPPDSHKRPISDSERELIRRWIEDGAEYQAFWAFNTPTKHELPDVEHDDWSKQSIDRFVLQKMESMDLSPSEEAKKRTLIRRLSLDLIGLPPTPDEVRVFLNDASPDAYENLVDRLLSREQFGEHIARYWLDLVRFADTNGMHKDFYRNFIAYRDWVIRAFNENLGYDDFVRYQLAGDLFENPTNDQLVASGFNRLHLIIDVGTALPEESFFKNVVDRVTATGTAFMGMTVHCAQCHDHKYDPITQKDFYSLFAFFNNIDAQPETRRAPPNGLQPPFISLGGPDQQRKLAAMDQHLTAVDKQIAAVEKQQGGCSEAQGSDEGRLNVLKRQRKKLKSERDRFDQTIPKAMVMKERSEVRPTHIHQRGQYDVPGELVERNTPGFLPELSKTGEVASRMDLANWFVAEQNPLTARVFVNRVWQQLFGVGLVKTSEDLGAQGEVPSHPELLDYLAVTFMESGWNVKALIKQIVMSQTYRQSSKATPEQFRSDPDNRLLARGSRYRLDAEVIRDQILATSGLLSDKMYGRSVKPPQPAGLWKSVTMTGEVFKADQGENIYRRSIYTYWKRAMPPPQMTILNAPNRDACISRRERTNTPSQALLLLNEAQFLKAARRLAQSILEETDDLEAAVKAAYETVTCYVPDAKESRLLVKLANDLAAHYGQNPALAAAMCDNLEPQGEHDRVTLAAVTVVVNTLYNLDITKHRE